MSGVTSSATKDSRSTFDYGPPDIASVSPEEGATYGDWKMELTGVNFGRTSSNIRVLVGGLPCRDVTLVDPRTIQCLSPPSIEGKTEVLVEVDGVTSKGGHFIVMKGPAVDLVSPASGPSYGGTVLIVSGTHLVSFFFTLYIA